MIKRITGCLWRDGGGGIQSEGEGQWAGTDLDTDPGRTWYGAYLPPETWPQSLEKAPPCTLSLIPNTQEFCQPLSLRMPRTFPLPPVGGRRPQCPLWPLTEVSRPVAGRGFRLWSCRVPASGAPPTSLSPWAESLSRASWCPRETSRVACWECQAPSADTQVPMPLPRDSGQQPGVDEVA